MNIDTATLVYFSPTQTTKKVLESIAQGMQAGVVSYVDLTPPVTTPTFSLDASTVAIIGAPVYGGRLPEVAVERLRRLRGNGTPAVLVVVYGNRAFEDALLEMKNVAEACGFVPIAGAAFIGEHSYSTEALPIALSRPDAADVAKAVAFGQQVREKLARHTPGVLAVPGNYPYKERRPPAENPSVPVTHADLCTLCGQCANACPTAAITVSDTVTTDAAACIQCCACTRACPTGARVMEDPRILRTATWLYENYSARKEPEVYV